MTMKMAPLLASILWTLGGCAPDAGGGTASTRPIPHTASTAPSVGAAVGGKAAPEENAASYEVSLASAEADRLRARDLCDTGDSARRRACIAAADAAYDQAKSAAEDAHEHTR
jgi:hypothetical protein